MIPTFDGYTKLTEPLAIALAAEDEAVRALLGGSPDEWTSREVGDGNLNLVFIVSNKAGSQGVVVKGALPYVRMIGESWPLALNRIFFEYSALLEEARWVPEFVPKVFRFSEKHAAIIMEYLPPPHIILRKGLIQGVEYPRLAQDTASFLARTLFNTSDLHADAEQKRKGVALFSNNHAMCAITEQVIFTEPYMVADNNRWTSPQLDGIAKAIRESSALKKAILALKYKFQNETQALLHADLHTGSVMATPESTKMIDPEFGFYGPMGFDVGAVIANLFLAYYAQDGQEEAAGARAAYKKWILAQIKTLWTEFATKFVDLWTAEHSNKASKAAVCPPGYLSAVDLAATQAAYMETLLADTLGFAGAKMIRRIVGVAHVEDLESIADPDKRASCEKRAIHLAHYLMTTRETLAKNDGAIDAVLSAAEAIPAAPGDVFAA